MIIERHGVDIDLSYEHKQVCGRCQKEGRDRSKNNLHVYGLASDGRHRGAKCFACYYTVPSEAWLEEHGEVQKEEEYDYVGSHFDAEVNKKIKADTGIETKGYRGIRTDISKWFGVRYQYSQEDGSVVSTFYPTTKGYEIAGYKVRKHPKDFAGPYGETGKDCELFGQFRWKTGGNTCLIVGGECYSEDTEVYTDSGWKLFKDLSKSDLIMQVSGGVGEFVAPSRLISKQYDGEMVSFKSDNHLDLLVTPNHKMVGVLGGQDFYFDAGGYFPRHKSFRKAVSLDGSGVPLSADQLRFIVALSADAKVDQRQDGRRVAHFSFLKERKILRLKELLARLGLQYTEFDKASHTHWKVSKPYHTFNVQLPSWALFKGIEQMEVRNLSFQQKLVILEELPLWDGNYVKGRNAIEFSSKRFVEAAWVAELAITSGMHAATRSRENSLGTWYCTKVSLGKSTASFQRVEKLTVPYSGMVYCATVPSGQLFVRRNGKTVVCGNSDVLAAYQMLDDNQRNKQYSTPAVVSSTVGETAAYKQIQNNYEFFTQFKKIIVALDSDAAGKAAAQKVIDVLPADRVYVMTMRLKDPNEYVKQGREQEFITDFWAAKPYTPDGVKSAGEAFDEVPEELLKPRITLPDYMCKMQEMMGGGIIQGRILNIIGDTSTGKSTHINRLVYHWIFNSPVIPTIVTLEATAAQYMLEMLSIHIEKNLLWQLSGQEIIEYLKTPAGIAAKNELCFNEEGKPRFFLIDDRKGSIKDLEAQMELLYRKHGSRLFVIDVLTDVLRGSSEQYAEDHMNFQKNMVKHGVTIANVMHTRKPPQSPDGKLRKVSEYDALGTGSFVQSAAYNIVINRDKLSEDLVLKNTTEVDLPKCRGGKTGSAGKWFFEFSTSQCYDLEQYMANKQGGSDF